MGLTPVGADSTNLNTGNRTVEIVGTTATFSGAMPNKIGVGDVLQYGSTPDRAFISGRTSATVYTVQNATAGTPVATGALTSVIPASSAPTPRSRTGKRRPKTRAFMHPCVTSIPPLP